jgi:hypothetical protein
MISDLMDTGGARWEEPRDGGGISVDRLRSFSYLRCCPLVALEMSRGGREADGEGILLDWRTGTQLGQGFQKRGPWFEVQRGDDLFILHETKPSIAL